MRQALESGAITPEEAYRQIKENCLSQSASWMDLFISPAYAGDCSVKTKDGVPVAIGDAYECIAGLFDYNNAQAIKNVASNSEAREAFGDGLAEGSYEALKGMIPTSDDIPDMPSLPNVSAEEMLLAGEFLRDAGLMAVKEPGAITDSFAKLGEAIYKETGQVLSEGIGTKVETIVNGYRDAMLAGEVGKIGKYTGKLLTVLGTEIGIAVGVTALTGGAGLAIVAIRWGYKTYKHLPDMPVFAETKRVWDGFKKQVKDFVGNDTGGSGSGSGNGSGDSATNSLPNVPGRVQSRVNLETNGWNHVIDRHFNPKKNASQFTMSQSDLRTLLQSPTVVQTPVTRTLQSADGIRYVREVNVGRPIGTDKFSGNQPTSTMTVLSDEFGNLVTATPGKIQ